MQAGVDTTGKLDPDPVFAPPIERPRVTPLAPRRYALQLTMSQHMHDQLRRAQELLSHSVPSGDAAQVLERALDLLVESLEKRKCAAVVKPRASRESTRARYVPAHVRRAVWQRDGGQCTFVSGDGHRCDSRTFLELDHVLEVARGGRATVDGMRLRCHAHNQYTAELTFGREFMQMKRRPRREGSMQPGTSV
jgi:5-methylcytosine-specific restriction endonuclease McrA